MASSASKKLREHLLDQQEPFTLENFLSERRYMKRLSSNGRPPLSLTQVLMRERSYESKRGRKVVLCGTEILASVISKLIPTNSQEISNGIKRDKDEGISQTTRTQRIAESSFFPIECLNAYIRTQRSNADGLSLHSTRNHRFTHAGRSMAFKFGNLKVEAAADTKLHWIRLEDDMQLTTASLMKEASSNKECDFRTKEAPLSQASTQCKDTGDSTVSSSLWESLINSSIVKMSHVGFAKLKGITWTASSQYLRNKRHLQQRKQLLFDSDKEPLRTLGRKGDRDRFAQEVPNPEDMEKIIREQTGDLTNMIHRMNFDFSSTLEDWSDLQRLERRIGVEIGDAIMDEFVKEIVDLFLQ